MQFNRITVKIQQSVTLLEEIQLFIWYLGQYRLRLAKSVITVPGIHNRPTLRKFKLENLRKYGIDFDHVNVNFPTMLNFANIFLYFCIGLCLCVGI